MTIFCSIPPVYFFLLLISYDLFSLVIVTSIPLYFLNQVCCINSFQQDSFFVHNICQTGVYVVVYDLAICFSYTYFEHKCS